MSFLSQINSKFARKRLKGWLIEFEHTKSIFTHIPKCAGTSVSFALYNEDPWHYTINYYKENISSSMFDKCFKFAIVRNPFERLLSSYLYSFEQYKKHPTTSVAFVTEFETFEDFILNWVTEDNVNEHYFFYPQCKYIMDEEDNILIDYLGRLESLERDFLFIKNKLKVSATLSKSNSTKHDHFREYYNDKTRAIVEKVYQKDLEVLGYSF